MDIGGSYGFMGIIAAKLGYNVYSVDNFEFFPKGTNKVLQEHIWAKYNIEMLSIDLMAPNMKLSLDDDVVDVVLFLAVIEHLPNTSRYIFQQISRVLKKSGVLILDTPNDGSLISRLSFLLKGVCQCNTLQDFFYSDIPYTGHHRCYAMKELVYMVNSCNLKILKKEQFDLVEQTGDHAFSFRKRVHKNLVNVIRVIGHVNPSLRNYNWLMAEK